MSPLDKIPTFQLTGMHRSLIDAAEIARLEGMHKEEFVRLADQYWDEEIKATESGKTNHEELLKTLLVALASRRGHPHAEGSPPS